MQYRKFGKTNFQSSILGFGCMRFPTLNKKIDQEKSKKMIYYAIDHGVNYLDTAYPYHEGESEAFLGKILTGDYRKKVKIATKLPCWLVEKKADFNKFLNEQLARLKTEHIDFYLLHGLYSDRWEKMLKLGALDFCEKAITDGRIGHIGFSFHGTPDLFIEIIDTYNNWTMCLMQYNYMNEHLQAGTRGLKHAAAKGLAVVIMEPLLGGLLARPPADIKKVFKEENRNPVQMALNWIWNKPEVTTILSGMSSMEHVKQNIKLAEGATADMLSTEEMNLITKVHDMYKSVDPIPCTKCRYCMPCPNGVDIPRNFELYNLAITFKEPMLGKSHYNWHTPVSEQAGSCISCGVCEPECPQKIKISEWMPRIHKALLLKE
jgi:predicted aldo/keto reductase-like oxidoreductase